VIPAGYPWTDEHVRSGGVLRWGGDGFVMAPGLGDVRGRTPVAAVGSNASPAVLVRKLAAMGSGEVVLEVRELAGVRVGHSAHVSPGGYIPAAPYVGEGGTRLVVGWFDQQQLALLDATEPNYLRRRLGAGVDVYVSRWGVVAVAGAPVPLTSQQQLLTRLRPPALVAGGRLSDPAVAARVSAWLQREHAMDAGWKA
jgi:hypothetical protein